MSRYIIKELPLPLRPGEHQPVLGVYWTAGTGGLRDGGGPRSTPRYSFWESRKRAELVQWNGTGGVIVAIHV